MGWELLLNNDDFFNKKRYRYNFKDYIEIRINKKYENRLDLLARDYLGFKFLWYIIAEMNNIINPFDLPEGTKIKIPNILDIKDFKTNLEKSNKVTIEL